MSEIPEPTVRDAPRTSPTAGSPARFEDERARDGGSVAASPPRALPDQSRSRTALYLGLALALALLFTAFRPHAGREVGDYHAFKTIAAVFALMVGLLALVRYHSRRNNTLLFIGAGFIAAALLDAYHGVVTSAVFGRAFPSAPDRLAAWSWTTSRLYLATMLLASWAAGRREDRLGAAGRIGEKRVYSEVALLTAVCLAFFLFVPLPPAYRPDAALHRPESLFIAILFLLALFGYLERGHWRRYPFEHSLVVALILSFFSAALFVPFSAAPSDVLAGTAHGLKIASYASVLVGLVASMYELFRRVEESGDELARANQALHTEVEERIRAQGELEKAERAVRDYAERLQRSNRELEQFAYAASHDLQEPLRMVAGYTQLLARRYEGRLDEQADRYIEYAVDGAARMQRLIQDLLTYSRVETHGKPFQKVDSGSALGWALANLEAAIAESGASVTHDALPEIVAEPTQLGQLFQNLIGNAIKYRRDEPPSIHVGAQRAEDGWTFSVRDNGVGIAAEHLHRVFELFRRLGESDQAGGTGIGLAVCKRIAERHGGRIWVESTLGAGSTFFFTIPDQALEPAGAT